MTDVLKPERIEVRAEGVLVALQIGNTTLRLGYEDALKLSTWMRVQAKAAKAAAGDTSRHWAVVGNLEAINNGANPFARKWL